MTKKTPKSKIPKANTKAVKVAPAAHKVEIVKGGHSKNKAVQAVGPVHMVEIDHKTRSILLDLVGPREKKPLKIFEQLDLMTVGEKSYMPLKRQQVASSLSRQQRLGVIDKSKAFSFNSCDVIVKDGDNSTIEAVTRVLRTA